MFFNPILKGINARYHDFQQILDSLPEELKNDSKYGQCWREMTKLKELIANEENGESKVPIELKEQNLAAERVNDFSRDLLQSLVRNIETLTKRLHLIELKKRDEERTLKLRRTFSLY